MEQYVLDYSNVSTEKEINIKEFNSLVKKIKRISNNDVKNFMNEISFQKNKKEDVKKTLNVCSTYMYAKNLDIKEKLVVFYYIYKYHKIILNNQFLNLKEKKIIFDIDYEKPNLYTCYLDEKKYFFKIILKEDILLKKIYENYKIMQIYNIPMPNISLVFMFSEYKTILIPDNRLIDERDDKFKVFLEISNILRCFNKNNLFVEFEKKNIRFFNGRYYLINLKNLKNKGNIIVSKQIEILSDILDLDKGKFNSYEEITLNFFQKN